METFFPLICDFPLSPHLQTSESSSRILVLVITSTQHIWRTGALDAKLHRVLNQLCGETVGDVWVEGRDLHMDDDDYAIAPRAIQEHQK